MKKLEIKVISRVNSNRRELIQNHLKEKNLPFTFFDAADKSNITWEGKNFFFKDQTFELNTTCPFPDAFGGRKWMKIGEVGCFISHYMLWKELTESDTDAYLILEDDAEVMFDANAMNRFLTNETLQMVDMVLCQSASPNHPNGKRAFKFITDKISVKMPRHFYDWETTEGTTGYIVTKSGARMLLHYYLQHKMFNPVDNFITRCVADYLDAYLCPTYLQVGMGKYWKDTEIHYNKENGKTISIEGITFKYE
jgi:glycosyl transferase family 25